METYALKLLKDNLAVPFGRFHSQDGSDSSVSSHGSAKALVLGAHGEEENLESVAKTTGRG